MCCCYRRENKQKSRQRKFLLNSNNFLTLAIFESRLQENGSTIRNLLWMLLHSRSNCGRLTLTAHHILNHETIRPTLPELWKALYMQEIIFSSFLFIHNYNIYDK